ncbi:hypothetical protein ACFPOU_16170 [Massilia jejuensis]|uniref:Uncharacterized protein n=1 Tax=Massilia jejuensis TaxID=648894 RepID=A0ABW0PJQ4_9BURK
MFVLVVDSSSRIIGTEIDILENISRFSKNILICLNKIDLARDDKHRAKMIEAADERLKGRIGKTEKIGR